MSENENKYECLKLENQLCFPLYAASREVVKRYTPILKKYDLTYTQYIVMMVMWVKKKINIGDLGKELFLDTGTLSPLLKEMEKKGFVTRTRLKSDERVVEVAITEEGEALKERAVEVPTQMVSCLTLDMEEAKVLYGLLYKILGKKED
ncbi:MAG: MarR family transcriptional regulator [Treponemataceae bacterium]|nr:MarR family transcriptional regulator [Treponemataceae bacterium]